VGLEYHGGDGIVGTLLSCHVSDTNAITEFAHLVRTKLYILSFVTAGSIMQVQEILRVVAVAGLSRVNV